MFSAPMISRGVLLTAFRLCFTLMLVTPQARRARARDAGDLPLVGVEIGGDRLGGEIRARAAGIPGEPFKTAFRRVPDAN